MSESGDTKICPLCAETIKAAARVCPHCRKHQGRFCFVSMYDFLAMGTFLAAATGMVLVYYFWSHGRQFSPERYRISIVQSQLGIETTAESTNVIVSGVLTNASDYAWNLTGFQLRFFDAAGKLVDVVDGGSEYQMLPALAHSERSFRLNLPSRKTIPAHDRYTITVNEAKAPGFWAADYN